MEKSKIIGVLIGVVIVIVVGILGFAGYTVFKKPSENQTMPIGEKNVNKEWGGTSSVSKGGNAVLNSIPDKKNNNNALNTTTTTRKKEYMEDYEIIGKIEIPKTGLKCNILDETTPRSLEIAVTKIYTTSGLNNPGNTVIYGHNYRNSLFFSKNNLLQKGDKIYITDADKNKIIYEVYNTFETTSSDTTFYARPADSTEGKREITLSTCTDDASSTDRRLIVQAKEK